MFPFSYPATWYDDGTSNPNQNEDQTSEINILPTTSRFKDQGSFTEENVHDNLTSQFYVTISNFDLRIQNTVIHCMA